MTELKIDFFPFVIAGNMSLYTPHNLYSCTQLIWYLYISPFMTFTTVPFVTTLIIIVT